MTEFEKLSRYRQDARINEGDEVELFKAEIGEGTYPVKCLKCYKSGLRWCIFWEKGFCCEEVEEGEIEDIAKMFVKREKNVNTE
jgi:hypothetical protein